MWVSGPRCQYSGKIRFIQKPGVQDEGVATWLNAVLTPQQRYATGGARQSSGTGPCGDCRRSMWVPGSVFGKNSFHRQTRGTRRGGGRQVAKRSSDPPPPKQRYATGEPGKVQGRDRVGIIVSCGYRARGVSVRGKFVTSRNLGYEGDRRVAKHSSDTSSSGTSRASQAKFMDGTVWGL